jgi:Uma2 family endonuclease
MSLLQSAPIPVLYYPESDGEPMAETDVHIKLMSRLREALDSYFQNDLTIYVSANLFVYYVRGDISKRVAPDVFLVKGVPKGDRRVYKLWEEGQPPAFVLELSSRKTWREDIFNKLRLYEQLGVQEYFIFDPEYDYLPEPLVGWELKKGQFHPLKVRKGKVRSNVLGLDLVDTGETLRLLNPQTGEFLRTPEEAEMRLKQAEAEITRLQKELSTLKRHS